MSLRLKGLETRLIFASPDGAVTTLTKLTNFKVTMLGEILEEQYIGEEAPDFDDISNGVEVTMDAHMHDPEVFDYFQKIEDRRRRIADAAGKFGAVTLLRFPSGGTRRGLLPDLYFGDIPIDLSSRKAFAKTSLTAKGSVIRWVKGA